MTSFGSLVMCTDAYAGSVTDNDLTADCVVLDMIQDKGAMVLADKGFGIEDLCRSKGLCHNRPPMKFGAQYEEIDTTKNFDVATLRIHWAILKMSIFTLHMENMFYLELPQNRKILDLKNALHFRIFVMNPNHAGVLYL